MTRIAPFGRMALMAGAMALAGCGGGGDGAPPAATASSAAEGLWVGTTGDGRYVAGVVFEDGNYDILYTAVGDGSTIAGVVQGSSSTSGATFSSGNARDFNLEGDGVMSPAVSGSVASKSTFAGTVTYGPGLTNTFTATYDASYELTPSLAALAGTYMGDVAFSLGTETAVVTISGTGALSGTGSSGCAVSGTVTPRARGNAYLVSLTFGAAPCYFAGQTFHGIGLYDATAKRFYSVLPNAARTDGVLFAGTQP